MRLTDNATIPFSLTSTGRAVGPLELKIRNNKKKGIAPAGRAPIPFSLTRTAGVGGILELNIKKKIKKEIAPAGRCIDSIFFDKDRSGTGADRAQN
jgi:hypothetical protein